MKVFGAQTGMTATKFAGYAAAIQLAIAATVKFLEWMDKAEIKQGKLQKALGSTGVSIGASMQAQAAGYRTAGETGAKAAEDLATRIAKARRGLFAEYGVGTGGEGFEKLIQLTAGMSGQIPQWLTTLTDTFSMGGAPGGDVEIIKIFEHIGVLAQASGVDVDQFGNMVFDLAKEFVHLGVDAADATKAVAVFADEMGRGEITSAVGLTAMSQVFRQQKTAAGLQGRFLTAAFSQQNFGDLSASTQKLLNVAARDELGDKNATWSSLGIGQQAKVLGTLDPGQYAGVMQGTYEVLKRMGEVIATANAPGVLGMDWPSATKFFETVRPGIEKPEDVGEALTVAMQTDTEKFTNAVDEFYIYVQEAAKNQQEFTAGLNAATETLKSVFVTHVAEAKAGGGGLAEQTAAGVAGVVTNIPEILEAEQIRRYNELEAKLLANTATLSEINQMSLISESKSFQKLTSRTPGGTNDITGETEVNTPNGKFKVIIQYDGPIVSGTASRDASNRNFRRLKE